MAVINIHEGEEDYTILVWVCLASSWDTVIMIILITSVSYTGYDYFCVKTIYASIILLIYVNIKKK